MTTATTGVISAHETYSREEFLRRTGIGDWAFRSVKRRGLRTTKVGNRVFVRGQDWIDFLSRAGDAMDPTK